MWVGGMDLFIYLVSGFVAQVEVGSNCWVLGGDRLVFYEGRNQDARVTPTGRLEAQSQHSTASSVLSPHECL